MKNKGILLLELLIVVLIIAILTSIMLPKYMKAMQLTKSAELNTALETAQKNAKLYGGNGNQMDIGENIDIHQIQEQLAKYGNMSSINKQANIYEGHSRSANQDEGSIMIKFED